MKTELFLALALAPTLFAAKSETPSTKSSAPRYDADLYHKDREAITSSAELLYWTINEGSLDYAQKMIQAPTLAPGQSSWAIGKAKHGTYGIDPGLRISIGYFNAPKYWEVWGEYTWLHIHGNTRANAPRNSSLFLTGTFPQVFSNPVKKAKSSLSFNYNTGYAMLDRVFIPNPHLRVKALGGIGTVWLRQDWHVRYLSTTAEATTIRNRWNFGGAGMRGGVFCDWYWGENIYLTGGATVGGFLGGYHNSAKQTSSVVPDQDLRNSDYKDVRAALMAQFLFGFAWQKNYCSISRVEVFAGWELTPWFNLQEVRRSTSSTTISDARETWLNTGVVALQGFTARVSFNW